MARGSWLVALLCLAGCGYIGEPLPPSLNIPVRVTDLRVTERGNKIVIDFTAPDETTDGVRLARLGEVDLRIGPALDDWAGQARRLEIAEARPGPVHLEVPAAEWSGRDVIVGARASSRKGRFSEWNLVRIAVVPPIPAPTGIAAEAVSKGVRIHWQAPPGRTGLRYRVYRQSEADKEPVALGAAEASEYIDAGTEYGKTYRYSVEPLQGEAVGERSAQTAVTPVDRFAPAVPSGLAGTPSAAGIELNWNPNTEPDLAGYYLYRAGEGAEFSRAGETLRTPNYSDRGVEAGKPYRYTVSAVDQSGNESARAEPVEVKAPQRN